MTCPLAVQNRFADRQGATLPLGQIPQVIQVQQDQNKSRLSTIESAYATD